MVNIRQLRSISPPAEAELKEADARFVAALDARQAEEPPLDWLGSPYPTTYWDWWDRAVALTAVNAWVEREGHGERDLLVARWLLASPGTAYDRLARRPNTDAYAVAMDRVLRLLEQRRPDAGLQDLEIWVNLYDQWGKTRARRGERWNKLISRAHRLDDVRRQLCVWGRIRWAGGTRERGGDRVRSSKQVAPPAQQAPYQERIGLATPKSQKFSTISPQPPEEGEGSSWRRRW